MSFRIMEGWIVSSWVDWEAKLLHLGVSHLSHGLGQHVNAAIVRLVPVGGELKVGVFVVLKGRPCWAGIAKLSLRWSFLMPAVRRIVPLLDCLSGKCFFGANNANDLLLLLSLFCIFGTKSRFWKKRVGGRTERGSNEAKCEYFPEIEDPLVLYLRKRTRLLNAIHLSFGKSVSIFEEGHLPKIKLHDS